MDRHFVLEFARVTEAAALASARWVGKGDEHAADHAAVEAMRAGLNEIDFSGEVVIGEGERDEAPMLHIGEKVGKASSIESPSSPKKMALDIALDPLEGTTICSRGGNNALSVLAVAKKGCFLHAPDTYMEKIAVGPQMKGVVDLQKTPTENLRAIAEKKKCHLSDLTAIILDRPRHKKLIEEVRSAGARIYLIGDGDISAAIATCWPETGIDVLFGIGGAPEGVISAAALRCVGGDFQGRLAFRNEEEKKRALKMGVTNFEKIYGINDLAKGDVLFCATGVTSGPLLKGVRFDGEHAFTHSIVMRSKTQTMRRIEAEHMLSKKPASHWKTY